jgi:hypothetical protein
VSFVHVGFHVMIPDFLTFFEEYRELPVLWQFRSADY